MFHRPHGLAIARETQPWQTDKTVFELDPRMEQVWIAVQNMGTSGEFAVQDFQVAFVRDRTALKWQVPLLLLAWCVWLIGLIRLSFMSTVPTWRCGLGAASVVTLFWFLGLPGIGTTARPLAPAQFAGLYQPPPQFSTLALDQPAAVPPTPVQPGASVIPASPTLDAGAEPAAAITPRHTPMLEWVNREWDVLHAAVFFGLTMVLLLLTKTDAIWRLSAGMAALPQSRRMARARFS